MSAFECGAAAIEERCRRLVRRPQIRSGNAASAGPAKYDMTMKCDLRRTSDLTTEDQAALRELSLAVYPPEIASAWPGRTIEWAPHQWSVIFTDAEEEAVCYVGIILREARWNERTVKIGGIGGVKTHPNARGRGLATAAIKQALDFLHEQGDVGFALLVCEQKLIPFYERLGWRRFDGSLFVTQMRARVPFTFLLPMTIPIRLRESVSGNIDLLGPPW